MARQTIGRLVPRLLVAYLFAALAATVAVLLVDTVESLHGRPGTDVLPGLAAIRVYVPYALGFTLALGLVHWTALWLLNRTSRLWHASVGALLGLLSAGLGVEDGFTWHNFLLLPFTVAGLAAALMFHRVYYSGSGERGAV